MILRTRTSVAGLMGMVLVAAVGVAALKSATELWASVIFTLTCGVLMLGIVGAVCNPGPGRIWWIGFSVLGWGYLLLVLLPWWDWQSLLAMPLGRLVMFLAPHLGLTLPPRPFFGFDNEHIDITAPLVQVAHCLGSLLIAAVGGMLAALVFGAATARTTAVAVGRGPRLRTMIIALGGLALSTLLALAGSRTAPGVWTGATVLITWGLLALVALGAAFRQGEHRARWLGAALFGVGYLVLIAGATDQLSWTQCAGNALLRELRPWLPATVMECPAASDGIARSNARVSQALDLRVPMHFPRKTPLKDVLAHIAAETRKRDGRAIPIHVEPSGLWETGKTMESPVSIDLVNTPLRTTLKLLLAKLGLTYFIEDGVLKVNSTVENESFSDPGCTNPMFLIGQRALALLAAALGSVLAPLVCRPRARSAD